MSFPVRRGRPLHRWSVGLSLDDLVCRPFRGDLLVGLPSITSGDDRRVSL